MSGSLKRPQGKVEVSGSFQIVWHCAHGGLSGESMSHTFLQVYVHIFSIAQICRSHPASFCISLSSVYSCMFSTSMGGEKFRNLLCHHLGPFQSENSNSTYPIELFREFFLMACINHTAHCLAEFCMNVYTCMPIYAYTHAHTCVHACTYTHTWTSSF